MKLMVCLDEKDGMSFFGRRQSMDRFLQGRALELAAPEKLWMNSYSAGQFSQWPEQIAVSEDFLDAAPDRACCFAEVSDVSACLDRAEQIIIFRWNRLYPSDRVFPMKRLLEGWRLISREDFSGYSHDNITMEVYERCSIR